MGRSHRSLLADMFMPMKFIEEKERPIMWWSVLELKQGLIEKLGWVLYCIEVQDLLNHLCYTWTHSVASLTWPTTWWHPKGKKIELQALQTETANNSGIRPKGTHELANGQISGTLNLGYTCRGYEIICRPSSKESCLLGKLVICWCFLMKKSLRIYRSNMFCRWIVARR